MRRSSSPMMPLNCTIDMTDRVNAADVFPPNPQGQLLRMSAALTSSPMPEPAVEYVLTLRERHVQLMTSGCLRQWCKRVSMWLYEMVGY